MTKKQLIEWLIDVPDDTPIVVGMVDDMEGTHLTNERAYTADVVYDETRKCIVIIAGG